MARVAMSSRRLCQLKQAMPISRLKPAAGGEAHAADSNLTSPGPPVTVLVNSCFSLRQCIVQSGGEKDKAGFYSASDSCSGHEKVLEGEATISDMRFKQLRLQN